MSSDSKGHRQVHESSQENNSKLEERQQHEWEIQHGNQDFWKKSGRNVGNENVFNGKKPKASSIV